MRYKVVYHKNAQHVLERIQPKLRQRIIRKLELLADDPYEKHNEATKLQGRDEYRLRVGDWRIFYILRDNELILMAMDIKPRGQAYKH